MRVGVQCRRHFLPWATLRCIDNSCENLDLVFTPRLSEAPILFEGEAASVVACHTLEWTAVARSVTLPAHVHDLVPCVLNLRPDELFLKCR